jgi:hypothetical protein
VKQHLSRGLLQGAGERGEGRRGEAGELPVQGGIERLIRGEIDKVARGEMGRDQRFGVQPPAKARKAGIDKSL